MVTNNDTLEIETETTSAITPTTHTNGIYEMNERRFRIPADRVNLTCTDLPDEQRAAIKWFYGYCNDQNLGKDELATLLKKPSGDYYSYDSIYQALTGRRDGGLDNFVSAIIALRRVAEERQVLVNNGFIETRLAKGIFATCRGAFLRQKISFIFGDSQIGKSTALREYQRLHNHGETIYMDTPGTGSLMTFKSRLFGKLNLPERMSLREERRRFFDSVDNRMLLIFDNIHRVLRATAPRALGIFDLLQELYEEKNPGIIFSMTNEGRDEIQGGRFHKQLEQMWKRRYNPLQLPNVTPDDDLELFAKAYGLPPAPNELLKVSLKSLSHEGREVSQSYEQNPYLLQTHINEKQGLGVWVTLLQSASDIARNSRRPISWGAVLKAHCLDQSQGFGLI